MKPLALRHTRQTGLTLVELMVTVSILAFLMLAAMPSLSGWMRNTQIRTAAESIQNGLSKARNEAVRRNARVRLSLVSSLASNCALSSSATHWIVSRNSPADDCDEAPSETATPLIIEKSTPGDAASGVTIAVKKLSGTNPCGASDTATFAEFDGFGRLTDSSSQLRCIVVGHSQGSGNRTLNIVIGSGGQVRMCDPAVTSSSDPRKC